MSVCPKCGRRIEGHDVEVREMTERDLLDPAYPFRRYEPGPHTIRLLPCRHKLPEGHRLETRDGHTWRILPLD